MSAKNGWPSVERLLLEAGNPNGPCVELSRVEAGSGRGLVYVHGNPGFVQDFTFSVRDAGAGTTENVFDILAKRYRVIAFDRPGHGFTRISNIPVVTPDVHVQVIDSILQTGRFGGKPLLVGHSCGGAYALLYALAHPGSVGGLVLFAPVVYRDSALVNWPSRRLGGRAGSQWSTLFSLAASPFIAHELRRAFKGTIPERYIDYYRLAIRTWSSPRRLEALGRDDVLLDSTLAARSHEFARVAREIPIAIVVGTQDKLVTPGRHAFRFAEESRKAGGNVHIIKSSCGHMVQLMAPDEMLEAIHWVDERNPA
jgi:pimeloyl-ACP methyl ester carboxylesterase